MGCSRKVEGEGEGRSMGVGVGRQEASKKMHVRDSEVFGKIWTGFEHGFVYAGMQDSEYEVPMLWSRWSSLQCGSLLGDLKTHLAYLRYCVPLRALTDFEIVDTARGVCAFTIIAVAVNSQTDLYSRSGPCIWRRTISKNLVLYMQVYISRLTVSI